jgi:hypothetical protein
LFNPINNPSSSQKVPVSRFIIPSGITLAQFARLIAQAPNIPLLLIIDANSPFALQVKSSIQTFKIGSIQVTQDSVNVIPQFPVQSATTSVQTGYYQPQSPVSPQPPVPTVSVESSFPSPSSSSSALQYATQNPSLVQAAPSSALATPTGLNVNSNQATPPSAASPASDV